MAAITADNRTRRWLLPEYVLKGVYLGLLGYTALEEKIWTLTLMVALLPLGGLLIALMVAAIQKIRQGYQARGRGLGAFILFLLLESSGLVYGGILLGLAFGAFCVRKSGSDNLLFMFL